MEYRKGFKALKSLLSYRRFIDRDPASVHVAGGCGCRLRQSKGHASNFGRRLTERQSKQILAEYGIPIAVESLATAAEEAVGIARAIGYPVVLKIESPEITHKTEAGAVEIDVTQRR